MRFKPGQSGNAGGRSREQIAFQNALRLKAVKHANEVLKFFLRTLRDENEATPNRLKAGTEIFNRGLGLPQTHLDLEFILTRKLTELSNDELRELSDRLRANEEPPKLIEAPDDPSVAEDDKEATPDE